MKKVKKNKSNKGKRLMVVAVRHFSNNEHHWMAPEDITREAQAFAENGTVEENKYGKPVFSLLKEAENFAFSLANGETMLAQWEATRPTYMVVEEDVYIEVVERDSYEYPENAEEWSDAMTADFERKCDCEEFAKKSLWSSDIDDETEYAEERGYCTDEE